MALVAFLPQNEHACCDCTPTRLHWQLIQLKHLGAFIIGCMGIHQHGCSCDRKLPSKQEEHTQDTCLFTLRTSLHNWILMDLCYMACSSVHGCVQNEYRSVASHLNHQEQQHAVRCFRQLWLVHEVEHVFCSLNLRTSHRQSDHPTLRTPALACHLGGATPGNDCSEVAGFGGNDCIV